MLVDHQTKVDHYLTKKISNIIRESFQETMISNLLAKEKEIYQRVIQNME